MSWSVIIALFLIPSVLFVLLFAIGAFIAGSRADDAAELARRKLTDDHRWLHNEKRR